MGLNDVPLDDLVDGCNGDVLANVLDQVQPHRLAVFGDICQAVADRLGHGGGVDDLAVLANFTADRGAVLVTEDAHGKLGTSRTHQTGQAGDLSTAQFEARVVDYLRSVSIGW